MGVFDVVVVGGGIVGASSAYLLSKRGQRVLLLDQYDIPNEWASSGDHACVFKYTFGKDLFYTELAAQALHLWKDLQKELREEFYTPNGVLDVAMKDEGYEAACYQALKDMRLPVEKLGPAEIQRNYRILNPKSFRYAVFHPDGGMLWAQRAVTALAAASARKGTVIREKTKIAKLIRGKEGIREIRDWDGRSWKGDRYLFAAGPWSRELLSSYRLPLKVTRQELLYFRPPRNQGRYRPEHCPVFTCSANGFYGFPVHIHGFMKIGNHRNGSPGKPGPSSQEVSRSFENSCRKFLRKFMPDVAGFVDSEGKICHHEKTPDGDFILDQLKGIPNAFVVTGLSNYGFQFGPLVASLMTDLMLKGKTDINVQRFHLSRFD